MKLAAVTFATQVNVPGIGPGVEFTSAAVSLEYDKASDMVRIGGDDGIEVPRSEVRQWRRAVASPERIKPACHVCSRIFNNAQALGGHRRQTGHQ